METTNWLADESLSLFGSLGWNFFKYGTLYGILGLIGGIALAFFLNRHGIFQRTNKVWTYFAKLNFVYLPILLATLFGVFSAVNGIQKTVNAWIDDSAHRIEIYALDYVPQVQEMGEELVVVEEEAEKKLKDMILEGAGLEENPMAERFYFWFNKALITYMLDKMGYSTDIEGLKALATEEEKLEALNAQFFAGVAGFIKKKIIEQVFSGIQSGLFITFLPFILVPIVEYSVFFIVKRKTPVER